MLTSERDLRNQIGMLEDAIAEDSPYAAQLQVLLDQRVAALSRAQGTQYHPTDDYVGGNKQTPSSRRTAASAQGASEKQIAFLRRLVREKETDGLTIPTDLEQISKTAASALIDRLLGRPAKSAAALPTDLATDKQKSFLTKLLAERDVPDADAVDVDRLTKWAASALIDELVKLPVRRAAAVAELPAGAYLVDGRVIRVYVGQQSGHMLAQELVDVTAQIRDEAWSYLGLASRFVPADAHRMTVEECEAASLGAEDHGWCCVCGRRLDDPNSVERGIGPVCRAKQSAEL